MTQYVSFGCKFLQSHTRIITNSEQCAICVLTRTRGFCHWVHDSILIFVTSSIVCSIICWYRQTMKCWCLNPVRMVRVIPSHQKDYPRTQSGKRLGAAWLLTTKHEHAVCMHCFLNLVKYTSSHFFFTFTWLFWRTNVFFCFFFFQIWIF